MGVEYFNCGFCQGTTPDCACMYLDFSNIEGFCVCLKCYDKLRKDDYIVLDKSQEPEWCYLIKNLVTGKKHIYMNWEKLLDGIKVISELEPKLRFGIWKVSESEAQSKAKLMDSLLERNNNGGMTNEEVKKICDGKLKKTSSTITDIKSLHIGFRGHEGHISNLFVDNKFSYEFLMEKINKYIKMNGLPSNVPFLVTSHSRLLKYDYRELDFFCFPDKHISWFNSLEELEKSKWNPEEHDEETIWEATSKLIESLISYYKSEVECFQSKILELECKR